MSLDSTDLLLVQDTVTNTLHKVTFANLSLDVKGAINYDTRYVLASGDNITGDVTLGPLNSPNITFSASNGNADFSGTLGANKVEATDGFYGSTILSLYGAPTSTESVDISQSGDLTIGSNISITQSGSITADTFSGDGSALTNLPFTDYIANGTQVNQYLVWNGSVWLPSTINVLVDGSSNGQVLEWNGSSWIATSVIDGGSY
tara:strand:+ start:465 stop:1076 length:612 start_codon:yes stop_codon:yes gene_type:complete